MHLVKLMLSFLFALFFCGPPEYTFAATQKESPVSGGEYRRPLLNEPQALDPARLNDIYGRTVSQQIFDGLVQFDETLAIRPAIAKSWKSSRDGRHWTFSLQKGVKFHNGREVTAEDVVYSLTRLADPKVGSGGAEVTLKIEGARDFREGKASTISGLKAIDRYTVEITVTEAATPLVSILAIGYAKIVPREEVEKPGNDFGKRPVGTGPFRLVHWTPKSEIVLEANPDYFGGRPYLDKITYRIFPGRAVDQAFEEFVKGALEDTEIPSGEKKRVAGSDKYQLVRRSTLGLRFIGLNNADPILANKKLRQALNHAINKIAITKDVYGDQYRPAVGILPPGTYGYDPQLKGYDYNVEKAKTLLAEAGYPGGKGLPEFVLWSSVRSDSILAEHASILKDFSRIGITARFEYNTNWPSFNKDVYEGKLTIFRYTWFADIPDPDTFLYALFHSKSPTNFLRYRNPEADRALEKARSEIDYFKRTELYKRAERIILDDAPLILRSYDAYERFFQKYVRGIAVSFQGDPYIQMRKIWLDGKPQLSETK